MNLSGNASMGNAPMGSGGPDLTPDVGGYEPPTLPATAFSLAIDRLVRWIGEAASWLWLVLVLVIVFQVAQRYLFGQGSIALEELQWHIYGVAFLLGLGFCLQVDRHVRIDVLAEQWSLRTKARVELIGLVVFLLPFVIAVTYESTKLAYTAWQFSEVSQAPGGLPYRWLIKASIPAGFLLLGVAALSRLSRCTAYLFGIPRPIPRDPRD
ncbi:MAG: TRAP transporter small permease subunit [Rhodospirillales bacterium]|nr:TRAP transporter small permease subunit [Rhodospirillales bacterium]